MCYRRLSTARMRTHTRDNGPYGHAGVSFDTRLPGLHPQPCMPVSHRTIIHPCPPPSFVGAHASHITPQQLHANAPWPHEAVMSRGGAGGSTDGGTHTTQCDEKPASCPNSAIHNVAAQRSGANHTRAHPSVGTIHCPRSHGPGVPARERVQAAWEGDMVPQD